MIDYHQPDFYRFNEDSLKLVRYVLAHKNSAQNILDLGAGCGVIGLELARSLGPETLSLLELQQEYRPFLETNIQRFCPPDTVASVQFGSFAEFDPQCKFDLIVSNPPYYLPGKGQESPSLQRSLARTFHRDGWNVLLTLIFKLLSPAGEGYLVIKNDRQILKAINTGLEESPLRSEMNAEGGIVFIRVWIG